MPLPVYTVGLQPIRGWSISAIFSIRRRRPGDLGYGAPVAFDVNALEGFESTFLRRAARTETDGSFTSLLDPDLVALLVRRRFDVLWMHGYYSASHLLAATTQIALRGKFLIREEQTLLDWRPAWKRALKQILLSERSLPFVRPLHRHPQSRMVRALLTDCRPRALPRSVLRRRRLLRGGASRLVAPSRTSAQRSASRLTQDRSF